MPTPRRAPLRPERKLPLTGQLALANGLRAARGAETFFLGPCKACCCNSTPFLVGATCMPERAGYTRWWAPLRPEWNLRKGRGSLGPLLRGVRPLRCSLLFLKRMPNRTTNCTVCLLLVIGSAGTSSSTKELQARARAVFSEYRRPRTRRPRPRRLRERGKATRATRDIYVNFACCLMHTYVIPVGKRNAGKHLDSSTALPYLNSLIHQAAADYVSS